MRDEPDARVKVPKCQVVTTKSDPMIGSSRDSQKVLVDLDSRTVVMEVETR